MGGGVAPLFRLRMFATQKKHHAITMFAREGCADHFVCKCGAAPVYLRPCMLATQKQYHVITMLAAREGCAENFVCKWGLFEGHPTAG